MKNAIGKLIGIVLSLYTALGRRVILNNIDSFNLTTLYIFPSVWVLFNFFHQHLLVFRV